MAILTEAQELQYAEQGYLLVSRLVAPQILEAAEAALWRVLGVDAHDPSSWTSISQVSTHHEEPALAACYTSQLLAAAAQLAGDDPRAFHPPTRVNALCVFPQQGEWQWPHAHIDHAIKEHDHKTFPRAFRVATMLYLTDVPPHGGGTVVWPGSHTKIGALAQSDPTRYEMMWILGGDIHKAGLGDPVELTPRGGDVLFYHYLCAHSGSMNTSPQPRLAFNCKW